MALSEERQLEIRYQWCKGCGICYSICPKGVLDKDRLGKVVVINEQACIKCRLCEEHCPDYVIRIGG